MLSGFLFRRSYSRGSRFLLIFLLCRRSLLLGTYLFCTSTVTGLPLYRCMWLKRIRVRVRTRRRLCTTFQRRYGGPRSRSRCHRSPRRYCRRGCSLSHVSARSCLLRTSRQRVSRSLPIPHLLPLHFLRLLRFGGSGSRSRRNR